MFYETATNQHGMKYDPFKALIVPRPIGWGSISWRVDVGVRSSPPTYIGFPFTGRRVTEGNVA